LGNLTDDDFERPEEASEDLIGRIKEKTGEATEEIQRKLDQLFAEEVGTRHAVAANARHWQRKSLAPKSVEARKRPDFELRPLYVFTTCKCCNVCAMRRIAKCYSKPAARA